MAYDIIPKTLSKFWIFVVLCVGELKARTLVHKNSGFECPTCAILLIICEALACARGEGEGGDAKGKRGERRDVAPPY